ncbi:hypothetical protein M513_12356 [Trichuris suis]|uniref:Uncharacterized protein n=1 Tax=Trichuris suis TaxID=68888 RepID=A0A085LP79_9BILA|nr:hypothetical protein M513_12356 [Trichuris suis]
MVICAVHMHTFTRSMTPLSWRTDSAARSPWTLRIRELVVVIAPFPLPAERWFDLWSVERERCHTSERAVEWEPNGLLSGNQRATELSAPKSPLNGTTA